MKEITIENFVELLNQCMQEHDDFLGEIARTNEGQHDIEIIDIEGNNLQPTHCKLYMECNRRLREVYKIKV